MRTLGGALASHLASSAHTRCKMLRLDLKDGTTLAITDHDRPLTFDLGDGPTTYWPRTGILPSDLSLSTGYEADEVEINGPVVSEVVNPWDVSRTAVLGGRFDEAVARYFMVNWKSLASGPIRLMKGYVVKADVEGSAFKLAIHSEITKFQQEIGRVITGYCDADFGDARCGYTPVEAAATVTGVTDERQFTVSTDDPFADNYFNRGTVRFDTGDLAGTRPVEITDWSDAGAVLLFEPLAAAPAVGDTLTLRQGCYDVATQTSKTRQACMTFDNVINFRGFPDVPGTDQVLRYPNPGG